MQILRNIWSQLHRFVFWALLSTILWAWIFTIITDTVPEKKVTLYVQTEDCRSEELALKLSLLPDRDVRGMLRRIAYPERLCS